MVPSAWKLVLYGLVIVVGSLIALPNLLTPAQREALPDWLPDKPVALGLDLRGGAHLVLEIDARALRREQMDTLLGDAQAVLRDARIGGVRGAIEADMVVLRANTPQIVAAAERALRTSDSNAAASKKVEVAPDGSIRLSLEPASLAAREQSALQQSVEIVRRRIDAIGVAEPTVQALGSSRILMHLPGVQDPASIRTLLGSTAKLTFHRVESSHPRFFALTGLEFNLTGIAALLTLIGYSVNDEVVVYDRMRENLRLHPKVPLREIIDRSINETLGRSVFTSVTAFLAMLPMAIWGGATVASFAVPMVFGIVVAASSSVFIAAPILLFLGDWRKRPEGSPAGLEAANARGVFMNRVAGSRRLHPILQRMNIGAKCSYEHGH